jgi:hypothetical protein
MLTSAPNKGECLSSNPGSLTFGKELRHQMNRNLNGPQYRSGRFGEKNSCTYRDFNPVFSSPLEGRCTAYDTPAGRVRVQLNEHCACHMHRYYATVN